jgi:hypothetical protein
MKLTNDSYLILLSGKAWTERYYRDGQGWLKVSVRGQKFRMTAEQVLNHLLPALAGQKPSLSVKVKHRRLAAEVGARLDRICRKHRTQTVLARKRSGVSES